jgi:hypothetical protein
MTNSSVVVPSVWFDAVAVAVATTPWSFSPGRSLSWKETERPPSWVDLRSLWSPWDVVVVAFVFSSCFNAASLKSPFQRYGTIKRAVIVVVIITTAAATTTAVARADVTEVADEVVVTVVGAAAGETFPGYIILLPSAALLLGRPAHT